MTSFAILLLVGIGTVVLGSQDLTCNQQDTCAYKPSTKTPVKTGLGRYEVFNALLQCSYPTECGVKILKDFSRQLDDMKGCTMYYPLKVVGEDRLFVIFGCESVIAFEEAMAKKDSKFKCSVTPIMDYYDFAMYTLGVELNQTEIDGIMPRQTLMCEILLATKRELDYPPGKTHDKIIKAWRDHAKKSAYFKARQTPGNAPEVFHVVGEETTWIFKLFESTERNDKAIINGDWTLQKKVTSGITHTTTPLIHLDCIC